MEDVKTVTEIRIQIKSTKSTLKKAKQSRGGLVVERSPSVRSEIRV